MTSPRLLAASRSARRPIVNDFKYGSGPIADGNKQMDDGMIKLGQKLAAQGKTAQQIKDAVYDEYAEDCDWLVKLLRKNGWL